MNVRAQVATLFHLDKCIGCHTCSISCKNIWTDRQGAEYMWWNNVETKPGSGYPFFWEDQEKYRGGWEKTNGKLKLKLQSRAVALLNIFFNPFLPTIDDYYEPWTYSYSDLFKSREEDDQISARPVSLISGKPVDIKSGPNWDDDLAGSPLYAENDPNLKNLSDEDKEALFHFEKLVFFYLPRICNHCLNPACVAACPAGAIYKRGEDGIVLVSQDKCRGWRMCISGCPYKKVYYNWETGKAEKCILCYPRLESGQPSACFHSCVGRIRYIGILLYDADRIEEAGLRSPEEMVEAQREIILDPFDPVVQKEAVKNGINEKLLEYAQNSPVYKFVKIFKIAFPLHPEFRTLPMLFYVPPLLPVYAQLRDGKYFLGEKFFSTVEENRIPIKYLSSLFSAGNSKIITEALRKLITVRAWRRFKGVGDVGESDVKKMMEECQMTERDVDELFKLTSLSTFKERFVIPPFMREIAIEAIKDPYFHKAEAGFGFRKGNRRGP